MEGRKAFQAAMEAVPDVPATLQTRAYILADLVIAEYSFGDCTNGSADFKSYSEMSKGLIDEPRQNIGMMLKLALLQMQGRPCPPPEALASIVPGEQMPVPSSSSIPALLNAGKPQNPGTSFPLKEDTSASHRAPKSPASTR